jgi:LacI family transcriptional regulator
MLKTGVQPTMCDIAQKAGVSVSTVSRVLNHKKTVSPELRDRVLTEAERLGYSLNRAARSLRSGRTNLVGLVIPDITTPFFAEIARIVGRALGNADLSLLLCDSDEDPEIERRHLENLEERRVEGLLISPSSDARIRYYEEIAARGIPVVLVDRLSSRKLDSVRTDNIAGTFQLVAHLISRGYHSFGIVAGRDDILSGRERMQGFKAACRALNIPDESVVCENGLMTSQGGYQATKRIMKRQPRPRAIFVATSVMGIGALRALKELGCQIPQDVALAMFDDTSLADLVSPPITVISQHIESIGQIAAQMLLERMKGNTSKKGREVLVQPSLIVRQST